MSQSDTATKAAGAIDAIIRQVEAGEDAYPAWRRWCRALREKGREVAGDATVATALVELATYPGWKTRVDDVRRILRAFDAVNAGEPPPINIPRDTGQGVTDALRLAGYLEAPDGLRVPPGYLVSDDGAILMATDGEPKMVSHRMIACVGRAIDAETGDALVSLVWWYAGRWVEVTTPRRVASDARTLLGLSDRGAPVDSGTAAQIVAWLREQEQAADGLPTRTSLGRLGWTPDGRGYALGEEPVGCDIVLQPPGDGERDHARAYVTAGTADSWAREVWPLVSHHPSGLVVLAAFAAPLLVPLDAPGWALDIGSESSTGKTTSLRAAASVYGDPLRLITPWPRTWAAAREAVAFRHSLPTLLDDTKNLDGRWEIAKTLVYAAADRQSQALGAATGGTRRAREVRTILLSTGEAPLAAHCGDARGATARMISAPVPMWRAGHVEQMLAVHPAVAAHHGAVGRRWIEYLHAHRDRWPAWRETYKGHCEHLAEGMTDEVGVRVSHYVAQLRTTAALMRVGLGLDVPTYLLDLALELARDGASNRDTPRAAWDHLSSVKASQPQRWHDANEPKEPYLGCALDNGTAWYPHALHEALERAGFPPADVLPSWRSRGWLRASEAGRHTTKVMLPNGGRQRMYVLLHDEHGEPAG